MPVKNSAVPTMDQWARLYSISKNIKDLAPWENLFDTELIVILLPGSDMPYFCSTLGMSGECFGIVVYPGVTAFDSFNRIADASELSPPYLHIGMQDCMTMYLGDRDELVEKERKIIRGLGYKFRGHNNWIYFRRMKPGFYPWTLTAEEADTLAQVLENYFMAFSHYCQGKLKVDFDAGEVIVRSYSPENELWLNAGMLLPDIKPDYPRIIVYDELILGRLKKQKKTKDVWEVDAFYLPTPMQENRDDVPFFPECILLANHGDGLIIGQDIIEQDSSSFQAMLRILDQAIINFGRPASIMTRSKRVVALLADFCKKIGVNLPEKEVPLPAIDACVIEMLNFMDSETFDELYEE